MGSAAQSCAGVPFRIDVESALTNQTVGIKINSRLILAAVFTPAEKAVSVSWWPLILGHMNFLGEISYFYKYLYRKFGQILANNKIDI